MIIYKCIVTGDEMFSDIYKIITTPEGLIEVEGKCVTRKVGDIDESLLGSNPSAEESGEGTDSCSESGVDIVLNHKLSETSGFDRKGFALYLKTYVNALKAKLADEDDKVKAFKAEAEVAGKKMFEIMKKNKEITFYTGNSMNPDGAIGLLDYREDGVTPFLIFMKCGLEIEKC